MPRWPSVFFDWLAIAPFLCGLWWPNAPIACGQALPGDSAATAQQEVVPDATAVSQSDSTKPDRPTSLASARQAVTTFILAMERRDYRTAITALDFTGVEPAPGPYRQVTYAQRLKACMDKLALVDPSEISDAPEGPVVPFPPGNAESEIVISRGEDGKWRFAADTVAGIDAIYKIFEGLPARGEEVVTAQMPASAEAGPERAADEPSVPDDEAGVPVTATVSVPDELRSARRTMRTFVDSLASKEYDFAVAALDFSELVAADGEIGPYAKLGYARRLKTVLDRMAEIDFASISDDPNGPPFRFPPNHVNQPVQIVRGEAGVWRFSADTVARIDALHEVYKDRPILNLDEEERPWYDRELALGNETWRIMTLFAAIFVSLLIGHSLRTLLKWRSESLERGGHRLRAVVFRTLAKAVVGVFFLIGLSAGMAALVLEHDVQRLASTVLHVVFAVVLGYICFRLVDVAVEMIRELAVRTGSTLNNMLVPIVSTSLRLTIVVLVLLEIATAISDQPPSAVLAGLGAGGLAIGLAAQDTIKNLFGSVMIFADRPFELGDRIVIDGHDGPVEAVGFRSTRIRTLDGHLVTIPNGEMANRTIHNIGQRPYIRQIIDVRVAYDTPPEKVRRAMEILRRLLVNHEGMRKELPPRVFLQSFLDSAICVRAIVWYHPPAYWEFCDFNERLHLQIVEEFAAEGVRFGLPSQRLVLAGDPENPSGPTSSG